MDLSHELESLRARRSELEDLELAAMERVEEHEAAIASLTARLEVLSAEHSDAVAAVDAALADIAAERANAAADRAVIVAALPADLVALYDKQRARYGIGASRLRGNVSEPAGVVLDADDLARIRAAAPETVILCPVSDAILIRE